MPFMTTLQPVEGPARDVYAALQLWIADVHADPLVVRTSGSTGDPKDVVLSRGAVLASARAALARLGGRGQWLLTLPVHYVAGMQVLVRSVLADSQPVLRDEHVSFAAAASAMTGKRRYVSLVPTQLVRLLSDHGDAASLTRFDAVLLGGGPADVVLLRQAQAADVRVVRTYGMSETCGGCVYDGLPLDEVAIKLDGDGRIHLSGPMLFDGYRNDPALTAQTLVDGWLRTPDVGRLDGDGRLEVLGRVDDVVVSGGVNIALSVVEQRLREHPAIADAAAVGVDDPEWGTRVIAVVVARERLVLNQVRDFVAETLPRGWAPRGLSVVPEIPLLGNGKVDRRALWEMV